MMFCHFLTRNTQVEDLLATVIMHILKPGCSSSSKGSTIRSITLLRYLHMLLLLLTFISTVYPLQPKAAFHGRGALKSTNYKQNT